MKTFIKEEIYLEIESKDIDRKVVLEAYQQVLHDQFKKVLDQFSEMVRFDLNDKIKIEQQIGTPVSLRILTSKDFKKEIISK